MAIVQDAYYLTDDILTKILTGESEVLSVMQQGQTRFKL
jgi:hypothetical protein